MHSLLRYALGLLGAVLLLLCPASPPIRANAAAASVLQASVPQAPYQAGGVAETTMWINYLDQLPGDPSVQESFNAVSSGVGAGLSGLIVTSTTTGDVASPGGDKVVAMVLSVPPGLSITAVTVCYEVQNMTAWPTTIDQIRIAQLQDPPTRTLVLLDDATAQPSPGPVCTESLQSETPIDPSAGSLELSLRLNFASASDRIVIRGLGLVVCQSS